ncbi:uncharacterized protein [Leptinotarsa decemlineata]|uniref:uncharacterized protein n=1 Tax=Leptinotarsa decemlineata TaxID=7539 RepID=UPI003D30A78F
MPEALSKQSQQIVASLKDYFEGEHGNGGPLLPLTAVRDRVADALKLSITTVNRIATKSNRGEIFSNPSKQWKRAKPVVNIDDFDQTAILIYDMYKTSKYFVLIYCIYNI